MTKTKPLHLPHPTKTEGFRGDFRSACGYMMGFHRFRVANSILQTGDEPICPKCAAVVLIAETAVPVS